MKDNNKNNNNNNNNYKVESFENYTMDKWYNVLKNLEICNIFLFII